MTVDMESRLRQALEARAAEVEPGTRTWELVQARLRRSRQRRLALAGVAAVAAIVLAAVAVPALLGGSLVQFDGSDAPVADQPAESSQGDTGEEAQPQEGAPPAEDRPAVVPLEPCHTPASIAAVWSRGGDLWSACANGNLVPLTTGEAADRNPAVTPGGDAVVFERTEPGTGYPVLVYRPFAQDADETVIGGGSLPAFAPDGRLARVLDAGDGTAVIQIGELFSEPEDEVPVVSPSADVVGLAWDAAGERVLYSVASGEAVAVWSHGRGAQAEAVPASAGYLAVAHAPDGTVAGLRRGDGAGRYDLVLVDAVTLDGSDAVGHPLVAGVQLAGGDLSLAPAGYLRVEAAASSPMLRWSAGDGPAWFLRDGAGGLYLVDADGAATHLEGDVQGASANPAAEFDPPARDDAQDDARDEAREAHTRAEAEQDARARAEQEARARAEEAAELQAVETTRRQLATAAAAGDLDALRRLMVADFSYSFGAEAGRDGAVAYLEERPEVLAQLPVLLEQPHGTVDSGAGRLYVWPSAHAVHPSEWTSSDIGYLRALGASDAEIEAWRAGEGYTGLRTGVDQDGRWRFYVAGD